MMKVSTPLGLLFSQENDDGTSKILDRTEVDLNRSEESDEDDDDGEAEDLDDFIQNGMLDEVGLLPIT